MNTIINKSVSPQKGLLVSFLLTSHSTFNPLLPTAIAQGAALTCQGWLDEGGVTLAAIEGWNQKIGEPQAQLKLKEMEICGLKQRLGVLEQALRGHKTYGEEFRHET